MGVDENRQEAPQLAISLSDRNWQEKTIQLHMHPDRHKQMVYQHDDHRHFLKEDGMQPHFAFWICSMKGRHFEDTWAGQNAQGFTLFQAKRYIDLHGRGNIRGCGFFAAVTWVPSQKTHPPHIRLKHEGFPQESFIPHRVCFWTPAVHPVKNCVVF